MRTWPALEVSARDNREGLSRPDAFQAALLDYDVAAIDDNAPEAWRVFFSSAAERDRARSGIAVEFPDLSFAPIEVPDEDWAARSQASLRAVHVGSVVVAPPWDVPAPGSAIRNPGSGTRDRESDGTGRVEASASASSASITIIIQPSMGFGTGHHATTRLCLAALQQLNLRGRSVIDVGTGSGVLAIAAHRLGASPVVAIDDDPDAIQAAAENVRLNDGADLDVRVADLRTAGLPPFDVVFANLTGGLLIQAAARLQDLAVPSGRLILSGFMHHEAVDVLEAFAAFAVIHRAEEEEWLCVTLQRR
jgi:ribosomal protein L11 methyltransferase